MLLNDGIYRFSRDGPATTRLGISSALPVHTADLLAVQAGGHAGDLVYLLARQSRDNVNAALYRSADSGKTWQRIASSTLAHLSALPARIP